MTYFAHLHTLNTKLIEAKSYYEVLLDWDGTPRELEVANNYVLSLESQIKTVKELMVTEGAE